MLPNLKGLDFRLTSATRQRIFGYIRQMRAVEVLVCVTCRHGEFYEMDAYATMSMSPDGSTQAIARGADGESVLFLFGCFPLICKRCGHTEFYNAVVLAEAGVFPKISETKLELMS